MAWRKNDPSLGNDPSYLEPRITTLENEMPKKIDSTEKGVPNGLATLNADGKVVDGNGNEVEGKVKSVNDIGPNETGNITLTKSNLGLGSVQNYDVATQAEAEAGSSNSKYMTPQRTKQAIEKLAPIPTASQITIADTSNLFTATDVENALSELFTNVSSGKNQIATAITGKGVSASGSDTFPTLATKIGQIETGVDTSDATAIASDILSPKTAYVNGSKITGAMINRGSLGTVTPSTSAKNYSAGYYNAFTVAGDSDLIASNIKSGVNLFNIIGTYVGEGKKTATGSSTSDNSNPSTTLIGGGSIGFTPSIVFAYKSSLTGSDRIKDFSFYFKDFGGVVLKVLNSNVTSASISVWYFLPVNSQSTSYNWVAIE